MESAKFALCSLPKALGSGMFAIFGQQNGQKLPIYLWKFLKGGTGENFFPFSFFTFMKAPNSQHFPPSGFATCVCRPLPGQQNG